MQLLMEDMQRSLAATLITLPDIFPEIEGKEVVEPSSAEVSTSQPLKVNPLVDLSTPLENLGIDGRSSASTSASASTSSPSTSAAAAEAVDRSCIRAAPDTSSVGRRPVMAESRRLPSQLAWG